MDDRQNERPQDGTADHDSYFRKDPREMGNAVEPASFDKRHNPGSKFHVLLIKSRDHFFDFILLFLAVFCGFMADNWRETMSEHQREKIFIRSIVEDISSDTLESARILNRLKTVNSGIDSVLVALLDPGIIENSNDVFRIWTRNLGLEVFVSNDRTTQQLKSNGELRLIRKKDVSDRIMKYDQTLKRYYTQSDLMYSALTDLTYYSQLFDFISLSKNGRDPVPLTSQGRNMLNLAYSHLYLWKRGLEGLIGYLEAVNTEGKELATFIQERYDLKKQRPAANK